MGVNLGDLGVGLDEGGAWQEGLAVCARGGIASGGGETVSPAAAAAPSWL